VLLRQHATWLLLQTRTRKLTFSKPSSSPVYLVVECRLWSHDAHLPAGFSYGNVFLFVLDARHVPNLTAFKKGNRIQAHIHDALFVRAAQHAGDVSAQREITGQGTSQYFPFELYLEVVFESDESKATGVPNGAKFVDNDDGCDIRAKLRDVLGVPDGAAACLTEHRQEADVVHEREERRPSGGRASPVGSRQRCHDERRALIETALVAVVVFVAALLWRVNYTTSPIVRLT
jgi:hypothetical protein